MGKILNTTFQESVDKVTGFVESLVNQPFYMFNDKKPTICTYYNINKGLSTLDPGARIEYDNIGKLSPFRFNKIQNFLLYGFQRIETSNDTDDFGVEANKIEGECYILPNTIVPTEGDYFEVNHIKDSTWLFIVKDVQRDTLENGSNVYKISYKLEYDSNEDIQKNVVENYTMIEVREGTNISSIVRCEDLEIAKIMDRRAVELKKYYIDLFYNEKVQTFIYTPYGDCRTYDPYMIEFLIRHSVLLNGGNDDYIHVDHKFKPYNTFSIDYNMSIFRQFEVRDKEKLLTSNYIAYLRLIEKFGSIFAGRYEDFFTCIYHNDDANNFAYTIYCLDKDFIYQIYDNKLETEENLWKNIIIKYFNGMTPLTEEEVNAVEYFELQSSMESFYLMPFLIFCLEKYIENVLK